MATKVKAPTKDEQIADLTAQVATLTTSNTDLSARTANAEGALRRFGKHDYHCSWPPTQPNCGCGLSQVLPKG